MRYKLSPAWTTCVFTQPAGGPQGMIVTVSTGGTYTTEPAARSKEVKQLAALRFSALVL